MNVDILEFFSLLIYVLGLLVLLMVAAGFSNFVLFAMGLRNAIKSNNYGAVFVGRILKPKATKTAMLKKLISNMGAE